MSKMGVWFKSLFFTIIFGCISASYTSASHAEVLPLQINDNSFTLSQNLEKYLAGSGEASQNFIADAMAKKWIRNAALRIFCDPLRSFLELIVNACDASVGPDKAVGKFGMGFFSILSFLLHEETDGAVITVKTICRLSEGESVQMDSMLRRCSALPRTYSPKPVRPEHVEGLIERGHRDFVAYSMVFEKIGADLNSWDDIKIKFHVIKDTELTDLIKILCVGQGSSGTVTTGTVVSIVPKNSNKTFSETTLSVLATYVSYLTTYRWVPVYLNGDVDAVNKCSLSPDFNANKPVNVILKPSLLSVIDRGTGLPLQSALENLLIPASSSKATANLTDMRAQALGQEAECPTFIKLAKKENSKQSHFLITVNGIFVVDKILADPLFDEHGACTDFKLEMPQATQPTLARNEILVSEGGKSFEEAYLKNVIKNTILNITQNKLNSGHLQALFKGLSDWEKQSAARHIKGRFTSYLKHQLQEQIIQNQNLIPVPKEYFTQFKQIFEYFAGIQASRYTLLPIDGGLVNYNFNTLEMAIEELALNKVSQFNFDLQALILKALDCQVVSGIKVFFVPDQILVQGGMPRISMFGLKSLLFVPESELGDSENISENIISKFTELDLALNQKAVNLNTYLIISTFADTPVYTCDKGSKLDLNFFSRNMAKEFLAQYPFLPAFSMCVDSAILTDLSDEEKLNVILSDLLTKFGATENNYKNGEIYCLTTSGKLEKLWPLQDNSAASIAKLFLGLGFYVVQDPNFNVGAPNNFINSLYRGITDRIIGKLYILKTWPFSQEAQTSQYLAPFKGLGFNVGTINVGVDRGLSVVNSARPVFVGMKGFKKEQLAVVVEKLNKFVSPAVNYDRTLKFVCPNFSAVNAFVNLFLFKNQVQKNSSVKAKISNLIEIISGFYARYFNIPECEFIKVYGKTEMINAVTPNSQDCLLDVDASLIVGFLQDIGTSTLLDRILQLQVDDFSMQTDIEKRASDLVNKKIYVPILSANTVLSLLTKFYINLQGVALERKLKLISKLVDVATSPQDLIFVLHLLILDKHLKIIKNSCSKLDNSGFDNFVDQIGDLSLRYIHEKVDEFMISDFYEKCRDEQYVSLASRLILVSRAPISKLVTEYLENITQADTFAKVDYAKQVSVLVDGCAQFSLKKLMRAHCIGSGLRDDLQKNDLSTVLKKVNDVKQPIQTNKIMQAVEAGSERAPIEAAIIECLQNSIDAIKSVRMDSTSPQVASLTTNGINTHISAVRSDTAHPEPVEGVEGLIERVKHVFNIKFNLQCVAGSSNACSHVLLTIQDFGGMPSLEVLLADLVLPDYSRKSPAQGNVGDMGNGLFKIYQAAKSVTVTTRLVDGSNKIFVLHVVPHRNSYGQVDDLDLQCMEKSPSGVFNNFWGTKFEILFNEADSNTTLINLIAAKDFLKNCAGATNVALPAQKHISVYYQDSEKLNNISDNNLLYTHKVGERVLFKVYKRENSLLQSYITTGGVPFRNLSSVAQEMALLPKSFISWLNNGLIVNLEIGTYQPVQSRTRLNLNRDIEQQLKLCLLEAFYLYTLESHCMDKYFLGSIFTNLNSNIGEFKTVMLGNKSSEDISNRRAFFDSYKSISAQNQEQKSFHDLINSEYSNGLVVVLNALQLKWQKIVDNAFADANLPDKDYPIFCAEQRNKFNQEKKSLFEAWKNKMLGSGFVPSVLITSAIIPWFENKIDDVNLSVKPRGLELKVKDAVIKYKQEIFTSSRREIKTVVDAVLKSFVNVYYKLNEIKKGTPQVVLKVLSPGDLGCFVRGANKILVSPQHAMLISNLLKLAQDLFNSKFESVKNNPAYDFLFGTHRGIRSGVVIHELEHSVRGTDGSVHDADFEDSAKQRVINIMPRLFSAWRVELTSNLGTGFAAKLNELITTNFDKIQNMERIDQAAFIEAVGF